MPALQALGQLISALVAVLGATGYLLVLGAVVLWVRLREAQFPKEVPISLASREELLVIGAQALAVWLVLGSALVVLAARLLTSRGLSQQDVIADLALGFSITLVTLAAIAGATLWVVVPLAILPIVSLGWLLWSALHIRPPLASVVAALVPATVGALLPVADRWLGDDEATGTILSAWAAFVPVLLFMPALGVQRALMNSSASAVGRLEMERADLTPAEGALPSPELQTVTRLLAAARERLRAARTFFWLRSFAIGAAGLLLLGAIAVASQFERKHLFHEGVVSLNTGRCVRATYLARGKDHVVLGDQVHFVKDGERFEETTLPNRVVMIPAAEVLELQVSDPVEKGIPFSHPECKDIGLIAPDGTAAEPFRGPKGEKGDKGEKGEKGDTG